MDVTSRAESKSLGTKRNGRVYETERPRKFYCCQQMLAQGGPGIGGGPAKFRGEREESLEKGGGMPSLPESEIELEFRARDERPAAWAASPHSFLSNFSTP